MTKKTKEELALEAYMAGLNEKKLNVSDNKIVGIAHRSLNPDWHKANTKRYEDPLYSKRVGKKISATYQTEEGRAIQAAKSKPHTEEAKQKIAQANIGLVKSDDIKQKLSVKKIGNQNRAKPIVTPYGIFSSKKLAAGGLLNAGISNAGKKIEKWLKTNVTEYYYISIEEYIMLTGKDI
jgi:hypothetical protein